MKGEKDSDSKLENSKRFKSVIDFLYIICFGNGSGYPSPFTQFSHGKPFDPENRHQ